MKLESLIRPRQAAAMLLICLALINSSAWAVEVFTDQALTIPGLTGSYVDRSLQDVRSSEDWRISQTISGTRIDPTLSFITDGWGARSAVGLTGGSDADWENFSVQWDGWLNVTQAGQRYAPVGDDGSRMWIDSNQDGVFSDDELLENGWGKRYWMVIRDRSVPLPVGSYRIRIQYYEVEGENEFHLVTPGWIPRQFVPEPGNPRQVVKALVINFEPRIPSRSNQRLWEVFDWGDPRKMARQFEADLEYATGRALDIQIVEERHLDEFPLFSDGFRYSPDQYVQYRETDSGLRIGVDLDFYHLARKHGLEELVNSGQVDEIWLFGDHYFNLLGESWMAGPNSFFINGPSFPYLGFNRAIAGYGFNYERGIGEMIHDLGHRTENHGQRAFGGWNFADPQTAFDHFSANYLDSPGRTAGIGTCHVPANADGHYDYGNLRTVASTAFDWANYPATTGATTPVSSATWKVGPSPDDQRDYLNFYFGMMPRNAGTAADGRQANWFKYIWDFNSYEEGTGQPRQEDAFGAGATITQMGATTHDLTVRYYDGTGVDLTTLDNNDILVTGPAGFSQNATLLEVGGEITTTAGTTRTVTYRLTAPGGTWDAADSGVYRLHVRPSQVRDTLGNFFPAGEVGVFQALFNNPPDVINVAEMLANGQASTVHTTIDIGSIDRLFDGSVDTLIRTPDIDPAVVILTFTNPQTVYGFRTYFSYADGNPAYRWQVETAETAADLEARTGTWQQAVALTGTTTEVFSSVILPTPITAKLMRLTATKLAGDDYVHINEWQLLGPPVNDTTPPEAAASSANVSAAGATSHFIEVVYTDASPVDVRSLETGNLTVRGPAGFSIRATFYSVDNHWNGAPRQATYWFIPPGGAWDPDDNGVYTLILEPGSVRDVLGNTAAEARALGSFAVHIPSPVRRPADDLAENNDANWHVTVENGTGSTAPDESRKTSGAGSIRIMTDGGADNRILYRDASGSDWDLTAATHLRFSVYAENTNDGGFQDNSPWLRLTDVNGGWFEYRYYQNGFPADILNEALGRWLEFTVPLRAGEETATGWRRTVVGSPRLEHIASLEFHADTWGEGFQLWFDAVGFDLPPEPPGQGESLVLISSSLRGSTMTLSLEGGRQGWTYALQRSPDMGLTPWVTIGTTGPLAVSGPLVLRDVAAPEPRAFYRVISYSP